MPILGNGVARARVRELQVHFLDTLLGSVLMRLAMMAMYGTLRPPTSPCCSPHKFPATWQTGCELAVLCPFSVKIRCGRCTLAADAHVEARRQARVIRRILLKMGGYEIACAFSANFPLASRFCATRVRPAVLAIVLHSLVALAQ